MLNLAENYIAAAAESQKLKRWDDPNAENVPATKLDGSYHIRVGDFIAGTKSHSTLPITVEITLRFWKSGYKDPEKGRRDAISLAEDIVKVALKYKNYIGNDVKSVILNSIRPEAMRQDNDNVTVVEISFTIGLQLGID